MTLKDTQLNSLPWGGKEAVVNAFFILNVLILV
jgi:hypothetical protein